MVAAAARPASAPPSKPRRASINEKADKQSSKKGAKGRKGSLKGSSDGAKSSSTKDEREVAKPEAEERRRRQQEYDAKAKAEREAAAMEIEAKVVGKGAAREPKKVAAREAAQRKAEASTTKTELDVAGKCAAELTRPHDAVASRVASRVASVKAARARVEMLKAELAAVKAAMREFKRSGWDHVRAAREAARLHALEAARFQERSVHTSLDAATREEADAVAQAVATAIGAVRVSAELERKAAVAAAMEEAKADADARFGTTMGAARAQMAAQAGRAATAQAEAREMAVTLAVIDVRSERAGRHAEDVLAIRVDAQERMAAAQALVRREMRGEMVTLAIKAANTAAEELSGEDQLLVLGDDADPDVEYVMTSTAVVQATREARARAQREGAERAAKQQAMHSVAIADVTAAAEARFVELEGAITQVTEGAHSEAARAEVARAELERTSDLLEAARSELVELVDRRRLRRRLSRALARAGGLVLSPFWRLRFRADP